MEPEGFRINPPSITTCTFGAFASSPAIFSAFVTTVMRICCFRISLAISAVVVPESRMMV